MTCLQHDLSMVARSEEIHVGHKREDEGAEVVVGGPVDKFQCGFEEFPRGHGVQLAFLKLEVLWPSLDLDNLPRHKRL